MKFVPKSPHPVKQPTPVKGKCSSISGTTTVNSHPPMLVLGQFFAKKKGKKYENRDIKGDILNFDFHCI